MYIEIILLKQTIILTRTQNIQFKKKLDNNKQYIMGDKEINNDK